MRRGTLLLLATMAAMLLAATGVVLAATTWKPAPTATANNDSYCGDGKSNTADALGGADTMFAKQGIDYLSGGEGNDAGTGNQDPNLTPATGLNCLGEDVPAAVRGGGEADLMGVDYLEGKIPGASDDGSDDLVGNDGNDEIADTKNSSGADDADDYDRVWGGTGKDTINVADGDPYDQVDCGNDSGNNYVKDSTPDFATIDVVKDASGNVIARDQTWNCEGNLKFIPIENQNGSEFNPADSGTVSQNQLSAVGDGSAADEGGGPPQQPAERGPKSKSNNK